MSEKIKGMFGNQERAEEVKNWLKSQGAVVVLIACTDANHIYYVREDGCVDYLHENFAELFDIVELPKPPHEFKPFDKVMFERNNNAKYSNMIKLNTMDKQKIIEGGIEYLMARSNGFRCR